MRPMKMTWALKNMWKEYKVEMCKLENNIIEKNGEQIMKENLQELHVQRKNWRGHNINFLCWAFYYVNDGKEVEIWFHQVMRCIMCYDNVVNILNSRTKKREGLIRSIIKLMV